MPHLKVNGKLSGFILKPQPIKVVFGGRGSGKSIGLADLLITKMLTEKADIYCLREFQDSINESVHRVLKSGILERLQLKGWTIHENKIISPHGAQTAYKGANRNPDSIQSAQNYKYSWFEEAHRASEDSLDKLLPTILRNPGAQCWFSGNPQSSGDPFSERFINPYLDEIRKNGFYEDDLHYIIKVNWRDNPWWNDELERLRQWDYDNLTRAKYDWIWEGEFNDSVENGLILPEWFDACVDAHEKLGFRVVGARVASHDPSDEGPDSKSYCVRHGSLIERLEESFTGNVNEGGHWACGMAVNDNIDAYTWDCDGLGVGLGEQTSIAFSGKNKEVLMFKGSESPDFPDTIYEATGCSGIRDRKTNKEVFKNKRAQYYFALRDRCYRTYRAVEFGEYQDPDKMISFSSKIKLLPKLRAELGRMPIKPNSNGLCELYTKEEMKRKFQLKSPNLADAVMMSLRYTYKPKQQVVMPQPIKPMGVHAR